MTVSSFLRLSASLFLAVLLSDAAFSQGMKKEEWKNNLTGLAKLSLKFSKDFTGKNEADKKKDFDEMCGIAADKDLLPALRYNAVLTIGQLDEKDRPPVPYIPALTYLSRFYTSKDTPDYLKYGALLGLVRSTYCILEPPKKADVLKLLLAALTKKPVADDDDLADWWQMTALEGLSGLKIANKDVVDVLLALIADEGRSLAVRAKAAKVFGDFDYKENKLDAKKISEGLQTFVQSVREIEFKKLEEENSGKNPNNPRMGYNAGAERRTASGGVQPTAFQLKQEEKRQRDLEFSALPPEIKILIEEVITESKMALQCVIYAATAEKKDRSAGVISAFSESDPAGKTLSDTVGEIQAIFKIFDEGVPGKERDNGSAAGTPRGSKGTGKNTPGAKENEPKEFKVNLIEIKETLAVKKQDAKNDGKESAEN
ncbi:MAG: hypothetical protein LBT46_02075 [Planctomycetaceae bacterium]|jgi:hypothetical protein|nr:hypothetical protein [Planctomycetaceae bacterium]